MVYKAIIIFIGGNTYGEKVFGNRLGKVHETL